MDLNYNLTQQQKLIMNQSMQQSLKLLQMSNYELLVHIDEQLQENPMLEAEYTLNSSNNIDYVKFAEYLKNDSGYMGETSGTAEDEVSPFNYISEKKSLKDYLKEQLLDLNENDYIKKICTYIVEELDSNGYLTDTVYDIASALPAETKYVENALKVIQSLEPAGIGAKDLRECLKLQVIKRGIYDENLGKIIDVHLEDIADNKYAKIAKNLNITIKSAQHYGDIIKTLEPKPSRGFYTGDETKYIIPDAYIERISKELYIVMNDKSMPKLSINNMYKSIVSNNSDAEAEKYIKEKLNSALFLIKSVEMRRSTIYKVLEQIVSMQKSYFLNEESFLKPMLLKDVAKEIDMHESTVSRAIKEKYVYTERGLVKIKDLFSNALTNEKDENVSVNIIKDEIKKLIEDEDKTKPVSDQNICDILNKKNFNISRRTVAKYREEMNIKASSKRKRF